MNSNLDFKILKGHGTITYKNGDRYHGHFIDDHFQGSGEMMYACGDIYSGEWVNSQCCGNGIYVYKSGDVYKGQFVQDKFNGYGILTWVDGSSYEGEFRDDYPSGAGIYRGVDGIEQSGHFHMGKYVGDYIDLISNQVYSDKTKNTNAIVSLAPIETASDSGTAGRSNNIPVPAPQPAMSISENGCNSIFSHHLIQS